MTDSYFHDESATFGDRMAAARERLGLSQAQLARRLGVKLQTVQGWEGDRAEPRANRLQMLAGLLDVSMVWLMTGRGAGLPAGADAPPEPTPGATLAALAAELRETRLAQAQIAERLARIEKRLQALAARG
jgi:transcriptional regulator with XRE-family HTH domain